MALHPEQLAEIAQLILAPLWIRLGTKEAEAFSKNLDRLLAKHQVADAESLLQRLKLENVGTDLGQDVLASLINTQGRFFDPYGSYKYLRAKVIPDILKARASHKELRIVSLGCGAGQDILSLAILIEAGLRELASWEVEYVGVDISLRQLERASLGLYADYELIGSTPQKLVEKYFTCENNVWQLAPTVTQRVNFHHGNIVTDADYLRGADLILCRHVLGQLTEEGRQQVLELIAANLRSSSVVVFGPNDELGDGISQLTELKANSKCYVHQDSSTAKASQGLALEEDHQAALQHLLGSSQLFGDLPRKLIKKLAARFELHEIEPGTPLVEQDELNEAFFIIYEGSVPVTVDRGFFQKDLTVARLGPGDYCGEMSLLRGEPCSASVIADQPLKVFAASRALFDFLRNNHEGFDDYMGSLSTTRREATEFCINSPGAIMRTEEIPKELEEFQVSPELRHLLVSRSGAQLPVGDEDFRRLASILRRVDLFKTLEPGNIEVIAKLIELWHFPDQATIIKTKDEGLALYLVDDGTLTVNKGAGFLRKGEDVAKLSAGAVLGEISILTFSLSNADVTAQGPARIFVMSRELFRKISEENRDFYVSINRIAKKRR
ncbi:MAG: CheR family methyltransferase [Myxococcota bacterium]|nr:CheR family methyltransferase [Myxococcota bacterium]